VSGVRVTDAIRIRFGLRDFDDGLTLEIRGGARLRTTMPDADETNAGKRVLLEAALATISATLAATPEPDRWLEARLEREREAQRERDAELCRQVELKQQREAAAIAKAEAHRQEVSDECMREIARNQARRKAAPVTDDDLPGAVTDLRPDRTL
jgi:hypothetical protein